MSNRNDNDNFNFEDDDIFSDRTGQGGGTADDLNFDEDLLTGDELTFEDEVTQDRRGPSRAFVILAVLIIILFLVGLGGIIFFLTRSTGPTPTQLTATRIVELNSTQVAFLAATQTQSFDNEQATATGVVLGVTATAEFFIAETEQAELAQTQAAVELAQTELAVPTETPEPSITPTLDDAGATAAADLTLQALPPVAQITAQFETQVAQELALTSVAATATAEANPPTATGVGGPGFGEVDDVLLTITALAQTLNPATPIAATQDPNTGLGGTPFLVPTAIGGGTGGGPTTLPDTGLFDDITGVGDLGALALIVLGLVGVIIGARRLRK